MAFEDIFNRGQNRVDGIWTPFQVHFITKADEERRVVLFGLYSNASFHGFSYLLEISGEKLVQIVDEFESNMAELSADEQKAVMYLATQRYQDLLEQQIHDQDLITERAKIDSQYLEFDAKFEALEQDRLAIETLQARLTVSIADAQARIKILDAQITEAQIDRQYVEVEISQKQLESARAELAVLEAGLKGLSIQLDIANAALLETELRLEKQKTQQELDLIPGQLQELEAQKTGLDSDKIQTETKTSMVDSEIAELQVRVAKANLDAINRTVDTALLDVDIAKAKLDTAMVDVDISETNTRIANEESKRVEYQTETAMVDVKVAQLQLDADEVQAKLKEIEADITRFEANSLKKDLVVIEKKIIEEKLANFKYEIPRKKTAQIEQIEKQIDILKKKIEAAESYQVIEATEHLSKMEKQQTEHDFRMAMASLDILYDLHKAAMQIESFSKDIIIAEEQQEYQELEDNERIRIPASHVESAKDSKKAAIDAAEIMASADIVNTMTHTIGAAS